MDFDLSQLAQAATYTGGSENSSTESVNGSEGLPNDLMDIDLLLPDHNNNDFGVVALFPAEQDGLIGVLTCDSLAP